MDFNITSLNNPIIDVQKCSINQSAVYQYMDHYPAFSFWLVLLAFCALLLYLYLPLFIPFFRRIGGVSGFIQYALLTLAFIGNGVGCILMIPVVFTLSESTFKILGVLQNIIIGAGFLGLAVYLLWIRFRGKKPKKY